jgi:hypothetical protein
MASLYYQRKPVPEGFEEILHDLIKEILRNQPEEIDKFCYNYFDKLIRKRKTGAKNKTDNLENEDPNIMDLKTIQDRFIITDKPKGKQPSF